MNEHSFEERLKQVQAPAPNAAARLQAKRAALAEFARVHASSVAPELKPTVFKAFISAMRLTRTHQQHGRAPMTWSTRNALFGTAASVSAVMLGLLVMWPTIMREGQGPISSIPLPPQAHRAPSSASDPQKSAVAGQRAEGSSSTAEGTQAAAVQTTQDENAAQVAASEGELTPPTSAPLQPAQVEDIVVSGIRESLQASMEMKKEAHGLVDSITAEDIGHFPDANLAEALQRIPGVSIARYSSNERDDFRHFETNSVRAVLDAPFSTFSIDVDTASYSYVRARLNEGELPEPDAVRVEEMINYFEYGWPAPKSRERPFEPTVVVSDSPWGEGKKLVHIGIKGHEIRIENMPDTNLVFLLDVSGSMDEPNKLPLVKKSMRLLLSSLKPTDTVGIVVYAGAAGVVLQPTPVRDERKILDALEALEAGGSTAGAEGIELAYQLAERHFRKGGVNRIVLATDGDFNVGITGTEELKGFVERQRQKGMYLSVLGFGQGNYRDELAQALAQNGNGVAAYIDTLNEARRVLVEQASGTLFTIAKDVKIQVEFNPETVAEYRLVGYETRALNREDFNNDAVDAGDIGSGHAVTAIYEITPVGSKAKLLDDARYGRPARDRHARKGDEYGYLRIRYKLPDEQTSQLIERPIRVRAHRVAKSVQQDVQFSTAVAGFGQLLRGGTYTGALTLEDVARQAEAAKGDDSNGWRAEFIELVRKAQTLTSGIEQAE